MTGFDENGFIYSKDYNEKVANRKIDGKQKHLSILTILV